MAFTFIPTPAWLHPENWPFRLPEFEYVWMASAATRYARSTRRGGADHRGNDT